MICWSIDDERAWGEPARARTDQMMRLRSPGPLAPADLPPAVAGAPLLAAIGRSRRAAIALVAVLAALLVLVGVTSLFPAAGPEELDRVLPGRPVSSDWLLHLSGVASSLGSSLVRNAILAVAVTALAVGGRWRAVASVAVTVSAVHLVERAIKALVDRPRPLGPDREYALSGSARVTVVVVVLVIGAAWVARRAGRRAWWLGPAFVATTLSVRVIELVQVGPGFDSYPSGHASNTMALVLALALVRPAGRGWTVAAVAGLVFVVAVGASRVSLGFHHPSDVLAGWFLAVGAALIVRPVFHLDRTPLRPGSA